VTYSIVARDPDTGELGVAVQSRWFSVGSVVTWAEPGVGAVATQSFAEVAHGPNGLRLLREGRTAGEALIELVAADEGEALRQVGIVDAAGNVAGHTGARCVADAGDVQDDEVSCQANMMASPSVWPAMLEAYRSTTGDLADRMLAALVAGEKAGGDARGRQSAALVVVSGDREAPPWQRAIELRVEDHPDPVGELARLLRLQRAFTHLDRGQELADAGRMEEGGAEAALAVALAPEDDQVAFFGALVLIGAGRVEEARPLLDRARAANPGWPAFLRRFAASGTIPDDPALLDAIMPLEG